MGQVLRGGRRAVGRDAAAACHASCLSLPDLGAAVAQSAFMLQQFNNPDNIKIHLETTGPEIWEQARGGHKAHARMRS